MSQSRRTSRSLRTQFVPNPTDPDDHRKRLFIGTLLVVGTILLSGLAVQDFVSGELFEAVLELIVGLSFGVGILRLGRGGRVGRFTIGGFTLFMIYIVVSGGEFGSKMLWAFVLPHIMMFTYGTREGSLWTSLILLISLALIIIAPPWVYAFENATIIRFAITYVIVSITALILESVRLDYHRRMLDEQQQLSAAMEKVEKMSITDPLTEAYNRGYLDRRLPEECSRARRYGSDLSVALCDVDLFKNVNDQFGHQVGDTILVALCQRFRDVLRHEIDWIARYGGEEFVVVLPETGHEGAIVVADRLRSEIEGHTFGQEDNPVRITCSFGIASFGAEPTDTHEAMIKRADDLLYQAKNSGRNQVCG